MNLTDLNTTTIANSGAALIAASSTALGADILALAGDHPVALAAIVAPFVGLAIGGLLTYIGRPSRNLVP